MLFKHVRKLFKKYTVPGTLNLIKKNNQPTICHFLFHTTVLQYTSTQSRIHRAKIRNKTYNCLSFFAGSGLGTMILDPQHCTNHIHKRYFLLHILAATGDCQMALKVWFWLQFPLAYIEMSSTGTGMVLLVITLFSIPIRSGLPECAAHVSLHLVLHGPTEPQPLRGREGVCEPAGDLEWSGNRDLDPQLQPAPASRIHTG